MYTYPEALDAIAKIAKDLFRAADKTNNTVVTVTADKDTGTASVDWTNPVHGTNREVTIFMPVVPATARMTETEFRRWAAYVLHEVGHPLDTDQRVWREAVRTNRHHLLNALEDVRMEKRQIERNIAANGKQVLTDLIAGLMVEGEANGFNINDPKSIGWTMCVLGRAVCNGYDLDVAHFTKGLNPNSAVAKVLPEALRRLGLCKSTQACLDMEHDGSPAEVYE